MQLTGSTKRLSVVCAVALAQLLAGPACSKSDGKDKPAPSKTHETVKVDTLGTPNKKQVTPFKLEYGPKFTAFMNEIGPALIANKGKCAAMAAAARVVVTKHAATIELMRDSNSPDARKWRAGNKALVDKFRKAMRHMINCRNNADVTALLKQMRGS